MQGQRLITAIQAKFYYFFQARSLEIQQSFLFQKQSLMGSQRSKQIQDSPTKSQSTVDVPKEEETNPQPKFQEENIKKYSQPQQESPNSEEKSVPKLSKTLKNRSRRYKYLIQKYRRARKVQLSVIHQNSEEGISSIIDRQKQGGQENQASNLASDVIQKEQLLRFDCFPRSLKFDLAVVEI